MIFNVTTSVASSPWDSAKKLAAQDATIVSQENAACCCFFFSNNVNSVLNCCRSPYLQNN